jgi:hypothetical protein
MPGLVPGIHLLIYAGKDVDGRDKPGHDESKACIANIIRANHSAGLADAAAAAAARSAAARFSTQRTDQTEPS